MLSAEGKVLLDYAERLLQLSPRRRPRCKGRAPHGALQARRAREHRGDAPAADPRALPPAHPAVRLELATGTTAALVARVLRGELEAAFVAEPFAARNLEAEPAFTEELVLITPKGQPRVVDAEGPARSARFSPSPAGCSYRRRLEAWLGRSSVVAERVMEYGSYHAIVACVAAGSGIAVVPRSVLRASGMEAQLAVHPLPPKIANARTLLVWRRGHRSSALDALRKELR